MTPEKQTSRREDSNKLDILKLCYIEAKNYIWSTFEQKGAKKGKQTSIIKLTFPVRKPLLHPLSWHHLGPLSGVPSSALIPVRSPWPMYSYLRFFEHILNNEPSGQQSCIPCLHCDAASPAPWPPGLLGLLRLLGCPRGHPLAWCGRRLLPDGPHLRQW